MGRKCAVVGCESEMDGKNKIIFHRFPLSDPKRLAEWLKLCHPTLRDNIHKGYNLMCSMHFRRDQYLNFNARVPRLVHNAVPFGVPDDTLCQQDITHVLPDAYPSVKAEVRSSSCLETELGDATYLEEICYNSTPLLTAPEMTIEVDMKAEEESDEYEGEVMNNHAETSRDLLLLENKYLKKQNQELEMKLEECRKKIRFLESKIKV